MAQISQSLVPSQTNQEEEEVEVEVEVDEQRLIYQQYQDLVSALPSVEGCSATQLYFHNGWYSLPLALVSANVARKLFEAKPDDILLATFPKSGTTWLKALLFATVNRNNPDQRFSSSRHHPLSRLNPHECVPSLEHQLYINNKVPNLDSLPSPRLFGTHIPFHALPNSIIDSNCRIVYLCRDPKDTFVSLWHFVNKIRKSTLDLEPIAIEVSFDHFCKGVSPFGPYSNHVLGYWNASLEGHGHNILFMVYEKLMEDPISELKRLAEFVGCPFTPDEDKDGVAEGIVRLCGFDNLSNLEVNKTGTMELTPAAFQNHMLFRRAVVGDWMNHLTPQMARDLDAITKSKFQGSALIL